MSDNVDDSVGGPEPTRSAPAIYLHIGTMKSGTSYIQGMLTRNRATLRDLGVFQPGDRWSDQVDAVRDVLEGAGAAKRNIPHGRWDAMAAQMIAWTGPRAVMSMEFLSFAKPQTIDVIARSLHGAELHVIMTARDLARVIPSAWQESTQNRQVWQWHDYVDSLTGRRDTEPAAFRRFWRQHDIGSIAAAWASVVGPRAVHLITVPKPGAPRDTLWQRFCSVIGIDPSQCEGAEQVRGNPAVGAASAEFLRRLNVEVANSLDVVAYDRIVKRFLAKNTLANRSDEPRLELPAQHRQWTISRARELTAAVDALGIDIVGDLQELVPDLDVHDSKDTTTTTNTEPSSTEVADAAIHALEALILRQARRGRTGDPEVARRT